MQRQGARNDAVVGEYLAEPSALLTWQNHRRPRLLSECTARNALFCLNLFPQGSWRVGYRFEARKGNRK
jgi:hypothetical protein